MPLPLFENEAEFRIAWVAPFLSKMGYILPKHVHGPNEQGKDFYFAEHDRFGHLRFLAAQVKVGNIGAGSVELTTHIPHPWARVDPDKMTSLWHSWQSGKSRRLPQGARHGCHDAL